MFVTMKILGIGMETSFVMHTVFFRVVSYIGNIRSQIRIDHFVGLLRYNPDVEEPVMLIQACELSAFGFFQRGMCLLYEGDIRFLSPSTLCLPLIYN